MNEIVIAKTYDLKDGDIKKVLVGKKKILLVRIKGAFHAVGGWCTHQRAPLEEGILVGERLFCPWHQACFNP
ncbi:MAG: Rieske 2Fe-2S domain-containing protein, partial [Desulfobacterales bacterium]|nr:Rieske 2Fe-2S domain-containing protein [Desulfobacterales bacterium]